MRCDVLILTFNFILGIVPQLLASVNERDSKLVFTKTNLVDAIRSDKPPLPDDPISVHPLKYAGE